MLLLEKLEKIKLSYLKEISKVNDERSLSNIFNSYLGKNGFFNKEKAELKKLSIEEKKIVGTQINDLYDFVKRIFYEKKNEIQTKELEIKIFKEKIDVSLPGDNLMFAGINPLYLLIEEITNFFLCMGYSVCESNDIETDYYNFELLNIPKNHPARAMQDTFYLNNDGLLLCTHTSHIQAHVMQENKNKPLRVISPGKCFRRDDDDLTHSHQFMQIEGLLIDKNINLGHLKETLEIFIKKIFGEKCKSRLRNSFFPFTEPSIEIDISCPYCCGNGCNHCKYTGYIEVLGAGVVNPEVLKLNGYDTSKYSGFAFGIGVERIAILKYGIDDIRRFYNNDIRFLSNFKRKILC